MDFRDNLVDYEAFGAQGDGIADDMSAICEAHDYANTHGLSVRTRPDAATSLQFQLDRDSERCSSVSVP